VNGESQAEVLNQFHLDGEGPVLGICPGAEFGPAKQWPAEHYAELANSLLSEGWRVWFFGSISDQLVTESIMADIEPAHFDRCANLVGKTTLGQAIDLLACARVVASNDSGLMHVAAALGKPIVAMYGSTSPDFTPPLADKVKLLSTDIECRPCFKRECPYGHLRCLNELSPALAIDAVAELIETTPQN
jgi:heptosyltransferase-2